VPRSIPGTRRTRKKASLETELIGYQAVSNPPAIRPAAPHRPWMGETADRFAYLCLPLVAANLSGWELLCPAAFSATWSGGPEPEAVQVRLSSPHTWTPLGHFGHGILTLHTGYLFRTSPEHNLWVRGPINAFKDGLAPLDGLIEADWLPYGFTMNYCFTRPNQTVRFEAGEAFCCIHPMPRSYLGGIQPTMRLLKAHSNLARQYRSWTRARYEWNAERLIEGSIAAHTKWRKDYLRGQTAAGDKAPAHEGPVKLQPFKDERDTD
jgi:hypothetical protein